MRRAGIESGLLGFCRKLSRDIFQLADPLHLADGGKLPREQFTRRRPLTIEPLEIRNFLNGTSVSAEVDPVWFQEVTAGVQSHAGTANWTAQGISTNDQQMVSIDGASDTYDWIVQFGSQYVTGITDIAQTVNLLAGGGIQFQAICGLGIVGQVLMRSSGAALDTVEHWLAADEHVGSFEEDAVRRIESTPNDPSMGSLWGMSKIDAYDAWNLATGATGNRVVVAEIDTGVDYTHPDLAANIWTNPNVGNDGFSGDLHGYDFANNDGDPMDDNGHGTHVAGTIGAVGNNGVGIAGVNWAVSIMPLKFMAASGAGYLSDAIRAINYATMERTEYGVNVRVINASWGGGGYSSAMQTAITAAGNAGILFVAAAGNDGANNDASPHYPANYAGGNVISVAATDQNDALASFSDYGATTVDLAAPGVSIYSTLPGNKYGTYSGTSMATPHVAGAAALAWAINPNATVADIRNALLQSVDHIAGLSGKMVSGGRLNVFHTLQSLQGNYTPPAPLLPTLGSLSATANNILPGTAFDLVANGAAAPAGSVTAVYFYADINNNGVFDASDFPIGADYNPVGGVGRLHIPATNMTAGTYRFFARALDSSYRFSDAVQTAVTVTATGMSNFTISANDVMQGTAVSLVAQGLLTGTNGIRDVYFYADLNNNGVFDASDFPIGASANANGTAQLSMSTAGMTPGVHRYFARALNTNYRFGEAVAQTLMVRQAGLESLAFSADNVTAGTTVQLLAQCAPVIAGNTEAVYFYSDINNNGVFDANDFPIGADANLANGTAKLTISTSNLAPGTYRFFARALDMQYHFGPASTTTLTVVAANNQNTTMPAPAATSISAGATLAKKLEAGGKEVWFQFQAVAGTAYTIRTELVTLRDSVLFLYDRDGKTLLATNDDGDSGLASRIDWAALKSGTYYFKVSAFDKTLTGDFRVSLMANSSQSHSTFVASVRAASDLTGISPRLATEQPAAGLSSLGTTTLIDRFAADSANAEAALRNRVNAAVHYVDTNSASYLDTVIDQGILVTQHDAISNMADWRQSDATNSLLESSPALRSILHSILFEEPSDSTDAMTTIQVDCDTIDALFAELAEEGWKA